MTLPSPLGLGLILSIVSSMFIQLAASNFVVLDDDRAIIKLSAICIILLINTQIEHTGGMAQLLSSSWYIGSHHPPFPGILQQSVQIPGLAIGWARERPESVQI